MKLSKSLLPTPRRWPAGVQLTLCLSGLACATWLAIAVLRNVRIILRGYPPRG